MNTANPQSCPDDPSVGFYEAAVTGSVEAHRGLREFALAAGDADAVSALESLVAAECYARMAAALGDNDDRRALVEILHRRADNRARSGGVDDLFRLDAAYHLTLLHQAGDPTAAGDIEALGLGVVWEEAAEMQSMRQAVNASYAGAAHCDLRAIESIISAADPTAGTALDQYEWLVRSEQLARLGSFSGDRAMRARLAQILFDRSRFEALIVGDEVRAIDAGAQAIGLMTDLIDEGWHPARTFLAQALASIAMREFVAFCDLQPDLLRFVEPAGRA